jgi:hypothetical protein
MPKKIFRIGNAQDPFSNVKLKDLPRNADAIKNMTFDTFGNLCKRAGYTKWNTDAIVADHKITGLHRFYKQTETSKYTLVVCDTGIYVLSEAAGHAAGSSLKTVTADKDTFFVDFVDRCLIVNGADNMMKFNGTTIYSSGVGQGGLSVEFLLATGWTSTGWTGSWAAGWTHTAGNTTALLQSKAAVNTTIYQITYTVTGRTAGSFTIAFGGQSLAGISASGVYEPTTSSTASLVITPTTDFDGKIVISIKSMAIPTGVAAGSGGSLSHGDYKYKVTFVDADGNEGNPSTASAAIHAVLSDKITVTIPVNADTNYNIVKRYIYRTLADGASYYYDGEVDDNTTVTFVSTQSDIALVQANSLENYHEQDHYTPPTSPSLIAKKGGRIYLGVGNSLYYSKRFYEYFPAEFFIPTGNMRNITGIISQLHTLQVATKNSVERLLGTSAQIESADYFQFKDSYSSKGAFSSRSVVDCDNYIVFLHRNGLYILNIDQVQELNPILNEYLKTNMNQSYIGQSCAVFYDGLYMLSYPKGSNTVPSETIFVDMKNGTYGIFDFAFNVYSVFGQDGEDSLKVGSTTVGRVYDLFSGLDDDGSAIEAYDTLPFLYFGNNDTYKQIYNFYIKIKTTSGTALRFYYQLDSENGLETETYIDKTLTANKTIVYKIDLAGGGQRCRGIKLRPRISDKFYFEIQAISIVYEEETPLWGGV